MEQLVTLVKDSDLTDDSKYVYLIIKEREGYESDYIFSICTTYANTLSVLTKIEGDEGLNFYPLQVYRIAADKLMVELTNFKRNDGKIVKVSNFSLGQLIISSRYGEREYIVEDNDAEV